MKTLRELMAAEIVAYWWLDGYYERGDHDAAKYRGQGIDPVLDYRDWLGHLDDDDFLSTYNRVREASDNLD